MSTSLRWGFLGAGFVATKGMAPAVHQASNAVLQVVGSQDLNRAAELGAVAEVQGYQAVLDAPDVDAIYVSLSNEQHRPWVERAAEAGKHVLCEKPLSVSLADTRHMLAAGSTHSVEIIEALWGRWHPRFAVLRDGFATGRWGEPIEFDAGFTFGGVPADNYRLDPSRGGGAWWDVGVYPLDLLLAIRPHDQVVVSDVMRRVGQTGVDLDTTARLHAGSLSASITTSIDGEEAQWLTITTDEGEVSVRSGQPFTSWRSETDLVFTPRGGEPQTIAFAPVDPYVVMIEDVSSVLLGHGRSDVIPTPEQMVRLSAVMDAVAERH
jgi:D-xylose 1-dehydrogenase (NADP+, D-xylono-1,5-lactone-forming)